MRKGWIYEQDREDFQQEIEIKKWLGKKTSKWDKIDFIREHYGRKGTPRNDGIIRSKSLQEEISEDGTGTFADLIAGCDGRDLEYRVAIELDEIIDAYLFHMGFGEEISEWVIKILKSLADQNSSLLEKYLKDSEW